MGRYDFLEYNQRMANELHIQLHGDLVDDPQAILSDFPFEPGQSILAVRGDMVIVQLGEADDTTYVQEWYLNGNDAVFSFFIVEE